jgi:hypothetical protein
MEFVEKISTSAKTNSNPAGINSNPDGVEKVAFEKTLSKL